MKSPVRRTVYVLGAVIALQAVLVGVYWAVERSKQVEVRAQEFAAPDLEYRTPDGRQHRLSEHRGRALLVHFWASWCPSR